MSTVSPKLLPSQRNAIKLAIQDEFTPEQLNHYKQWISEKEAGNSDLGSEISKDAYAVHTRMEVMRKTLLKTREFEVIGWGVELFKNGAVIGTIAIAASALLLRSRPLLCIAAAITSLVVGIFARDLHQMGIALTSFLQLLKQDKVILEETVMDQVLRDLVAKTLFVKLYLNRQVRLGATYNFFNRFYTFLRGLELDPLKGKEIECPKRLYNSVWLQLKAFSGFLTGAKRQVCFFSFLTLFSSFFFSYNEKPYLNLALRIFTCTSAILYYDLSCLQRSTYGLSKKIEAIYFKERGADNYKKLSQAFSKIRAKSWVIGTVLNLRLISIETEILTEGPRSIQERWTNPLKNKFGDFACWKRAAENATKKRPHILHSDA